MIISRELVERHRVLIEMNMLVIPKGIEKEELLLMCHATCEGDLLREDEKMFRMRSLSCLLRLSKRLSGLL